jgi:Cys-rich four helix bundle protein (predicted Tat secretion target)
MERRELLMGGAALATAAFANLGLAAGQGEQHKHEEHEHEEHDEHMHHSSGKYKALVNSAADCVHIGEECLNHCLTMLSTGDKELGECSKSVNQLLATCDALMKLAAQESVYTPKMAALAGQVCKDCEAECRKHEKKHGLCKACADSCAACYKECQKVSA